LTFLMFRILQIDQDTLAIHVNAGELAAHPSSSDLFRLLDLMRYQGVELAIRGLIEHGSSQFPVVEFGSSYLHELRHYVDLLLTPYGFYRIWTAFEVYLNIPSSIQSSEVIPIPLSSGLNPVTREVIGLPPDFGTSAINAIWRPTLSRIKVINQENARYYRNGEEKIGGDRILEALAFIVQFELLINEFSPDYAWSLLCLMRNVCVCTFGWMAMASHGPGGRSLAEARVAAEG
jgi:hypothetical protein